MTATHDLMAAGDAPARVVPLVEEALLRWSLVPRLVADGEAPPEPAGPRAVVRDTLALAERARERAAADPADGDTFHHDVVVVALEALAGREEDALERVGTLDGDHVCGNCSAGREQFADLLRSVLQERLGDAVAARRSVERERPLAPESEGHLAGPARLSLARLHRGLLRLATGEEAAGAADLQRLVDLCPGTTAAAVASRALADRDLLEVPTAARLVALARDTDDGDLSRLVETAAIRHGHHDGRWPFLDLPPVETAPPELSGVALVEHPRPDDAPARPDPAWVPRQAGRVAAWATRPPDAPPPDWREVAVRVETDELLHVLPDVVRGGEREVGRELLERLAAEGTEAVWRVPEWHAGMLAATDGDGPSLGGLTSDDVAESARRWGAFLETWSGHAAGR